MTLNRHLNEAPHKNDLNIDKEKVIESLIKTLSYSDIFSYPLKFEEIWKYLISPYKINKKDIKKILSSCPYILNKSNYYFLQGRDKNVLIRQKRLLASKEKNKKVLELARLLNFIPTIKLVGVSGSLSMNNADREDDIDIFIICAANTVWITRFIVFFILSVLGKKRDREGNCMENKMCPNMFLSLERLSFNKIEQNLFTAHEIVQLKVILNKKNTHERFLISNKWVMDYLPNSFNVKALSKNLGNKQDSNNTSILKKTLNFAFSALEEIFYAAQLFYMKKNISTEIIERDIIKFHPKDKKNVILNLYKNRYRLVKNSPFFTPGY